VLCCTNKGIHIGYVVLLGGFGSGVCFANHVLEVIPSCCGICPLQLLSPEVGVFGGQVSDNVALLLRFGELQDVGEVLKIGEEAIEQWSGTLEFGCQILALDRHSQQSCCPVW
jgi:hypothetical protein